jgi:hypothetical protein
MSAAALRSIRRGSAGGGGRAVAGLLLGILGVLFILLTLLDFSTGHLSLRPL